MSRVLMRAVSRINLVQIGVVFFVFVGLCGVTTTSRAQVRFVVPSDTITDFNQYDRIETCHALSKRMARHLTIKQDSIDIKKQIFVSEPVDSTSDLLRSSVRECMRKFHIPSIAFHDSVSRTSTIIPTAIKLYFQGNWKDRFLLMVDSVMDDSKNSSNGYRAYTMAFSSIRSAIGAVRPTDHTLVAHLEDKYVIPRILMAKDTGDVAAAGEYYRIMLRRIEHRYKDSLGKGGQEYRQLAGLMKEDLDSHTGGDESSEAASIRINLRQVYEKINFISALDSLRSTGPDGYFNALRLNYSLAGLSDSSELGNGLGYAWTPLAFIGFRYGGDVWYSDSASGTDKPENKEYPLMSTEAPQLILFLSALCRDEHRLLPTWARRSVRSRDCWDKYAYVKWFHKRYPDIPVTIITSTTGHYDELAVPDPYQEAELIKEALWSFHNLPANIVIYHTDYFTMFDPDRRRQDLDDANLRRYKEIPGISSSLEELPLGAVLLGSDGRIITHIALGWGSVKRTREIVDPYYSWYMSTLESTTMIQQ